MKWIHLCLKATTLAIQDCLDEGCSVEASRGTLRRHREIWMARWWFQMFDSYFSNGLKSPRWELLASGPNGFGSEIGTWWSQDQGAQWCVVVFFGGHVWQMMNLCVCFLSYTSYTSHTFSDKQESLSVFSSPTVDSCNQKSRSQPTSI